MRGTIFLALVLSGCAGSDGNLAIGSAEEAVSYKLNGIEFDNPFGVLRTFSDNKKVSFKNKDLQKQAFFQSIGTNGRTCAHCHMPGEAWTITPANVQYRFKHPVVLSNPDCVVNALDCPAEPDATKWGLDPIFRTADGANSPTADVSTATARQQAYSMLLTKGLIRVGMPIPVNAEFELAAVDDPYNYA